MSYCVNCGVELDPTAESCPLCKTPVVNPRQPVDRRSPPPFPVHSTDVPPASRREAAMLITAMLASVAVCCSVLNLFLRPDRFWSFFVSGGAMLLWVWLALPLWERRLPLPVRLVLDGLAVGVYVFLISVELDGRAWFTGLAAPLILMATLVLLFLGITLRHRSILSGITLIITAVGVFLFFTEYFVDLWLFDVWSPGWGIVILAVCVALDIPLIVVRRVPNLRESARRRFHL